MLGMISDAGGGGENQERGGGGGATSGGSSEIGVGGGFMTEEDKAFRNMEEGERNSGGGNRWPRQETIALLNIRSEMDVVFRDSSLKGPLWEEVSRKLADLGYHRSAKKCKEKFENVYKYHKRTKGGRASKADGKTYRFFEQLEALENTPSHQHSLLPPSNSRPPPPPLEATPINMAMPMQQANVQVPTSQVTTTHHVTVSSAPPPNNPFAPSHQNVPLSSPMAPSSQPSPQQVTNPVNNLPSHQVNTNLPSHQNMSAMSYSTSSSTSSDEDIQTRHKKKRKWKDFFLQLKKDVIEKQEELQRKFLETLEKRERDRMVKEEAWKAQERARMNKEYEILVQERSMAAAKDAAVISFLQQITEQHNIQIPNSISFIPTSAQVQIKLPQNPPPAPAPAPIPTHSPQPQQQTQPTVLASTAPPPQPQPPQPSPAPVPVSLPMAVPAPLIQTSLPQTPPVPAKNIELTPKSNNGGESYNTPASSSRWPKAEIEALIKLRTNLDVKYQENGPKGPLWEEISAGMKEIGYNRNAKRCKEKWENINKYFKKVKESNKKRPEDSKTCPYFHQLDALYREKAKTETSSSSSFNPSASGFVLNPAENNPMAPIMARPEQQWGPPHHQQQPQQHQETTRMDHDHESDHMDEDDDEDDEEEENAYEIVANKQQSSMSTANTTTTTTAATATTTV
ncbi:trihelix transcription factor DF1-like [Lycium barbarum]|uniref:trihelix transcription factor DF1-like n=1 Tax=Lycium barbarum TaxID=112863 RepID=UPI00293E7115|nr:trihelix transcription factor DF1-like [Lycium barbarum]